MHGGMREEREMAERSERRPGGAREEWEKAGRSERTLGGGLEVEALAVSVLLHV